MALFLISTAPRPTTAITAVIATGTAIKTLLQVVPSTTKGIKIVEWGISFEGEAAATPIKCELIETGSIAATVTAHVESGIQKYDAEAFTYGNPTTNLIQVGTALTGYNATAEGTITESRSFDLQFIAPTNQYVKQFPLGREPYINVGDFARIRVHAAATENAYAYMIVEV